MTRFWRDGFWRTSVYGNTHWVEGHSVERNDWERYTPGSPSFAAGDFIRLVRAHRGATARFVNPNADCPVCGEPVFYYQNENGSRVFFDELGPPWPKHPCTDNASFREAQGSSPSEVISPAARAPSQISDISNSLPLVGRDPQTEFKEAYNAIEWEMFEVAGRFRALTGVLLALERVAGGDNKRIFGSTARLPKFVDCSAIVFVRRKTLAYFDLRTMLPIQISFWRIRNASAFIDELLKKRSNATEDP